MGGRAFSKPLKGPALTGAKWSIIEALLMSYLQAELVIRVQPLPIS